MSAEKDTKWVSEHLKVGMKFKVYDNSYAYKNENGKWVKCLLDTANAPYYGEDGYELVITKIVPKEDMSKDTYSLATLPVVYLTSKVTRRQYKVGVCWNEACARGFNFPKDA